MRLLLAIALLLVAGNALADGWCGPDVLYFYGDSDQAYCGIDLVPLQEHYIEVYLESNAHPGSLAQVHFRVEGWLSPGDPPQGIITESWSADAVAGDLSTGITLTWNEGLASDGLAFGGRQDYHLGTISVLAFAEGWVPPEHHVFLRDVSYRNMAGQEIAGDDLSYFTFNGAGNCTDASWDPPIPPWCSWDRVSPPDDSIVGGDFTFSGRLLYYSCWTGPWPVSATVKLNGVEIGQHEGWEELFVAQPVDLSGIADDESFTITVEPNTGSPCQSSYSYTYTLDTTGAGRESFSAIKARY